MAARLSALMGVFGHAAAAAAAGGRGGTSHRYQTWNRAKGVIRALWERELARGVGGTERGEPDSAVPALSVAATTGALKVAGEITIERERDLFACEQVEE